jgi:hypothetical protein
MSPTRKIVELAIWVVACTILYNISPLLAIVVGVPTMIFLAGRFS